MQFKITVTAAAELFAKCEIIQVAFQFSYKLLRVIQKQNLGLHREIQTISQ